MILTSLKKYVPQPNVIAFDLDSTLITTSSGKKFPVNADDFCPMEIFNGIQPNDHIVIFTNQAYTRNAKRNMMCDRVQLIINMLPNSVGCIAFIADKLWKKPYTVMLDEYFKLYPYDEYPMDTFTYVGDAAGRPDDFADSDRKFAFNANLYMTMKKYDVTVSFLTPEKYLGNDTDSCMVYSGFNGIEYLNTVQKSNIRTSQAQLMETLATLCDTSPTFIITVGAPGSGKTTFAYRLAKMCSILVVDEMPKDRRLRVIAKESGSIISSQTNPTKSGRYEMISLKPDHEIVIIYWDDMELSLQIMHMRYQATGKYIPKVAYNIYKKKLNDDFDDYQIYRWQLDGSFIDTNQMYYFIMKY